MKTAFELAHIGINQNTPEEAQALASALSDLFGLELRHGKKSEFAGEFFECMRTPYLGSHGHIALMTGNLTEAVKEMQNKGVSFRSETAAYDEAGRLKNIYLEGEFGGFAIHILQK